MGGTRQQAALMGGTGRLLHRLCAHAVAARRLGRDPGSVPTLMRTDAENSGPWSCSTCVAQVVRSAGGRRRQARAAIGWPGEVLRRVRLVFPPVQQPAIDATTQIAWPRCHDILGYGIKAPNQAPLPARLDVPRLIDVFHRHAA